MKTSGFPFFRSNNPDRAVPTQETTPTPFCRSGFIPDIRVPMSETNPDRRQATVTFIITMHPRSNSVRLCRVLALLALTLLIPLRIFAQLPPRSNILSTMSLVSDYWTTHNAASGVTNNWNGAVDMIGEALAYDATGNSNYLNYTTAWSNAYSYGIYGGNTNRKADCQAAGEVYVRQYQWLGGISKLNNITTNVHAMVAGTSSTDWTWCDALNMAMPIWAKLGQIYRDPAYASRMHDFYTYTKTGVGGPGLYNPTLHLWYRDATFLGTNTYWSRGNAWVFIAHAKVLQILPSSDPNYAEYLAVFKAMAAELITLQQSDGFWYANLTNPAQYPTPETSGTAGFTYGFAWGIRAGILDSATYLPVVTKAWNGMVATAVHSDGFLGYVQGGGNQPSSNQPVTYTDTADFGVGLFLEAGYQVALLTSGQTVTPTYSPQGAQYSSGQSVTISSTTSGAVIHYTTDGTIPSSTNGHVYAGPVSIAATTTLKAIATASGLSDSFVASDTYTIQAATTVAAPTFTPAGGTYSSAQNVSISTTTAGASIRYTVDGSTPTSTTGTLYSGPVSISSTTTLKAIAYESGLTDSTVTTATYTISSSGGSTTVSAADGFYNIPFSPSQTGTFTATIDAVPSLSPSNTTIALCQGAQTAYAGLACVARFNPSGDIDARNGGAYAAASTIPYSAGVSYHFRFVVNVATHTYSLFVTPAGGSEITVGSNYAFRTEQANVTSLDTWNVDVSATPGGSVTVSNLSVTSSSGGQVAAPTFNPGGGTYSSAQSVTISTTTSGASIRYTTDGSTPTSTTGTLYSGPITVSSTKTVKAIAYESGFTDSAVSSATYTITATGDFSITAAPASQTVIGGLAANYTVTITPSNGFSGPVNLAVTGLPNRTNASFSPASVNGSGSSTLTISTSRRTSTGTFTLNITGSSGALSHSTTVTLVVQ
jgi:unsaturated rhamnogalacturonyl hydrolase